MEITRMNYEQLVIEQLREYKLISGRIKILEKTPIGYGMYLDSDNKDDKLQDLHRKLKGMPSHMYLNKSEQELESIAFAYLENYPLGTKAQMNEVKSIQVWDSEDRKQLKKLQSKIAKVIDARNGQTYGIKGVEQRISELQDLQRKIEQMDLALDTVEWIKPLHGKLLRMRYIDKAPVDDIAYELSISRKTYDRWRPVAIEEYAMLSGIAELCP
ncbi:DUF1492 domain-containing protein [Paenibacillus psychroresistens]|uniref:DUF1492 domain-containing protein n=1 Tax=Paenibacillus psychroresistens TaxID=1778678 RepID=A0A6B8RKA3_9BACL|nr:DUF1492 domain-containing protein [Paenibacillus psychroresistens]QGQ95846.1 DUF1492 domain-containing protein [Paenibacillus psychroresistens]